MKAVRLNVIPVTERGGPSYTYEKGAARWVRATPLHPFEPRIT